MPRKPRYEEAGAIHHVYARGVDRCTIFRDDRDRETYLKVLGHVVRTCRWECLAYCLMSNHVHLLPRTTQPNLGVGMQRLHSLFAQGFNERHGRIGHLFQGRYGSSRIRSAGGLSEAVDYIGLNPVVAGLCASADEWAWSGVGSAAAGTAPRWLASTARLRLAMKDLDG